MLPLTGYTDRFSVAPGETIAFKVSSTASEPYQVRLVRIICGDPNPAGPGMREEELPAVFAGTYPSRLQPVPLGSYARVADAPALHGLTSFTVAATIWPTTPQTHQQGIIARYDPTLGTGLALYIDAMGTGALLGLGNGQVRHLSVGKPLRQRAWYRIWAAYDGGTQTLTVGQAPLQPAFMVDDAGSQVLVLDRQPALATSSPLLLAALGGTPVSGHYNGKLERPLVLARAISDAAGRSGVTAERPDDVVAWWDFSQDIAGSRIVDVGPHGLHGELINLPARAMTGANWSGEEMCWRHAPEQYGAIHFHADDLYDCAWQTDFSFTAPAGLKSGVYAMRLTCGTVRETIPFFVRPQRGQPQANACVLIPTFTYTVYANYARGVTDEAYRERVAAWGAHPWTADAHRDYSLSTYNYHTDGSGICYASRLRPLITMRPGFLSYVDARGSGLRHLPADTHLFDWLEVMGHDFDVITDDDLHAEGVGLIAPYKVVLTTSHPEYHTRETLEALSAYTTQGGGLMYLGGNGFYWRVALSPAWPGAIEIRRSEGGIRVWAAEPGEYYHSFDGQYGGLWRRNGRPPQQLVGVGFTSQGTFAGSYYRRQPDAQNPRAAWIFAGVEDDILGDFGLSGGGAAGFELDRADPRLGTPAHALVLARSEGHKPEHFILVHEEQLGLFTTWPGVPAAQLIHADMVYFETPNGGAVFSVGSITFCGSLAHNHYNNNISRLVNNVLTRFRTT
jgi:N,N-dimethylformamidase beta subunit-like, C-terminal